MYHSRGRNLDYNILKVLSSQLISLTWGLHYHIFKPDPKEADFEDEDFLIHVLIRQLATFGPAPASYATLIADGDDSRWDVLGNAIEFIQENNMIKPFALAKDKCLTEEDKEFILKIMKFDPRDRPTAAELLRDKWFVGVPRGWIWRYHTRTCRITEDW